MGPPPPQLPASPCDLSLSRQSHHDGFNYNVTWPRGPHQRLSRGNTASCTSHLRKWAEERSFFIRLRAPFPSSHWIKNELTQIQLNSGLTLHFSCLYLIFFFLKKTHQTVGKFLGLPQSIQLDSVLHVAISPLPLHAIKASGEGSVSRSSIPSLFCITSLVQRSWLLYQPWFCYHPADLE